MQNATPLPPDAWIFTLKELLNIPSVREVIFVQIPVIGMTPQLSDALGQPLSNAGAGGRLDEANMLRQTYRPIDAENKEVKIIGTAVRAFEVFGSLPKPWMPAPGMFSEALVQLKKAPLPIMLVWKAFNIETFEYHAISTGLPDVIPAPARKQINPVN